MLRSVANPFLAVGSTVVTLVGRGLIGEGMPYKDAEAKKRATREAVRRHRGKVPSEVIPEQNVSPDVIPPDVPHFMEYVIPGPKRLKMEKIVLSLGKHAQFVFLGYPGWGGIDLGTLSQYMEATK